MPSVVLDAGGVEVAPVSVFLRDLMLCDMSPATCHDDGRTLRIDPETPLMAVRALYFDLQAWATQEPHRWAQWVAPCPVHPSDTRGGGIRRRRIHERMAGRTRRRQPLLPLLVAHVERNHQRLAELLTAATSAASDTIFTRSLDPTGRGRARWTMRWKPALNAFAITFGDRFPAAETY